MEFLDTETPEPNMKLFKFRNYDIIKLDLELLFLREAIMVDGKQSNLDALPGIQMLGVVSRKILDDLYTTNRNLKALNVIYIPIDIIGLIRMDILMLIESRASIEIFKNDFHGLFLLCSAIDNVFDENFKLNIMPDDVFQKGNKIHIGVVQPNYPLKEGLN